MHHSSRVRTVEAAKQSALDAFRDAPTPLFGIRDWSGFVALGNHEHRSSETDSGDEASYSFSLEHGSADGDGAWVEVTSVIGADGDEDPRFVLETTGEFLTTDLDQTVESLAAAQISVDGSSSTVTGFRRGRCWVGWTVTADSRIRLRARQYPAEEVTLTRDIDLSRYVAGFLSAFG